MPLNKESKPNQNERWNWSAEPSVFANQKKLPTFSILSVYNDSTWEIALLHSMHYAIGAVISQIMENGEEKLIAYSQHLIAAEKKLCTN